MDDDDADYMQGSDDVRTFPYHPYQHAHETASQDYGFDYSGSDSGNEAESADVENMYYTAKCEYCPSQVAAVA